MKSKTTIINTIIYMDDLKGLKLHKLNNNNIRCIEIPRNLLKQISDINLINNSGIYFLHNLNSQSLYVGQTDDLLRRFLDHNKTKDFDKIIAFTVENNDWSRTYIDYLEWHYINEIKKQDFWILDNDQPREKKPNISQFEEPMLLDLIDNIDILLFANNVDFSNQKPIKKEYIFSLNESYLIYVDGQYKMLKDSKIPNIYRAIEKANTENRHYDRQIKILKEMQSRHEEWIKNNIIQKFDINYCILTKDIIFNSPSIAAMYAKGHYALNGWTEWKNNKKKTLDDVYRK